MSDKIKTILGALRAEGLPAVAGESLAQHTTFRIGGSAAVFAKPQTVPELMRVIELCHQQEVRYYLLGNGSNTLFADTGFDGVVISTTALRTTAHFEEIPETDTVMVRAGAGMMLGALCTAVQAKGLTGLEFAYGIPGTLGGAVYMNAGAYGGELKDVLHEVSFLDQALHLQTLPTRYLELGYRTSVFEKKPWCIVEAAFVLQKGDPDQIQARMQTLMQSRRDKQPLELPSAGSTFKRPQGAFAGKLIEDCGLRGYRVGGAAISEKHCGFVVNLGGATCADVVALTEQVSDMVKQKTGYTLQREIRVVE